MDKTAHLVGHIDALDDGCIAGWAILVADADGAVTTGLTLEMVHDGVVIASFVATDPRADVASQLGGDGRCGFRVPVPCRLRDGLRRDLHIRHPDQPGTPINSPVAIQATGDAIWSRFVSCKTDFERDSHACHDDADQRAAILRNRGRAEFIEDLGEVFPGYRVTRPAPRIVDPANDQFERDLADLYGSVGQDRAVGTSSRLVRLSDVYVCNSRIHHISGDDVLTVYETARPPDRPYTEQPDWTPQTLRAAATQIDDIATPLYLGSPGYGNYGHWLTDDLARAKAAEALAGITGTPVQIVIPRAGGRLDDIKTETLAALYPANLVPGAVFIPSNVPVHVPVLYYVSPHSYHPVLKSPTACRHLRARAEAVAGPTRPSGPGTRLFVTRARRHGRGLTNYADIAACLARFGFQTIDPDQMAFTDQAAAFVRAKIVVGQMGAAMTNTMFCAPGTKLLYLAPRGWVEPFYWDLAAVCSHEYIVQYGPPAKLTAEAHRDDFTIDAASLAATLDALLSR